MSIRNLVLIEEGLGNAIEALPMIYALKVKYPDETIDALCSPRAYLVLSNCDIINKVILLNNAPVTIKEQEYDYGFYTQYCSGTWHRFMKSKCKTVFYNASPDWTKESEAKTNVALLMGRNIRINENEYRNDFPVKTIEGIHDLSRAVCIHVGCVKHPNWASRHWPESYWVELIKRIYNKGIVSVIICGPDESDQTLRIISGLPSPSYILMDSLDIKEVAYLLKKTNFLISIDSGIMHLASTQRINQIAIFGPTSEIKSRPINPKCVIVRDENTECGRCYVTNKKKWLVCKDSLCMKNITVDRIFNLFEEMERKNV